MIYIINSTATISLFFLNLNFKNLKSTILELRDQKRNLSCFILNINTVRMIGNSVNILGIISSSTYFRITQMHITTKNMSK